MTKWQEVRKMNAYRDASNRHMTWWRNVSWPRIRDRPALRTAKGRRRTWRAATRAVEDTDEKKWREKDRKRD